MKKLILTLTIAMIASKSLFAQEEVSILQKQVFGKGITLEPLQLSFDVYPFLFLERGIGGSGSLEFSNWQIGVIGFTVIPPDFITQTFFNNSENLKIRKNTAVEIFGNYYLRKDRKGIYTGIICGPEWFVMEEKLSGKQETIVKSYLVPRLGFRVFPFKKYFYIDASFGWSFNLSGTEDRALGETNYSATDGGLIFFLQIGMRFNLAGNQE